MFSQYLQGHRFAGARCARDEAMAIGHVRQEHDIRHRLIDGLGNEQRVGHSQGSQKALRRERE